MSGNEAIAEGALAAGCDYYGGYPITPSTEIMEHIGKRFCDTGGTFMQMEDELAAIGSVIGASWAGARAMTATSGPGFSLMQESIGYAVITETPLVLIDVQRSGPSTGQATRVGSGDIMQAKWGSHGDYQVIALCPWSVQEAYEMTIEAFNMAQQYRTPVFIMTEEAIGHLREGIELRCATKIAGRRTEPGAPPFGTEAEDGVPPMPVFGEGAQLLITGSTHDEYGVRQTTNPTLQARLIARLNNKILHKRGSLIQYELYNADSLDVLVVAYGFTARSARHAVEYLEGQGTRVGLLRLKTLWPFADLVMEQISGKAKKILVPEMNRGQIAGEIRKYVNCEVVSLAQTNGEIIHPQAIIDLIQRSL